MTRKNQEKIQNGSSFGEHLHKVLLPFREEYRQKCRNTSVIGGFDRYVLNWLEQALHRSPLQAETRSKLEQVKARFAGYAMSLPRERAKILKETHPIINSCLEEGSGDTKTIPFKTPGLVMVDKKITHPEPNKTQSRQLTPDRKISLSDPITSIPGIGESDFAQFRAEHVRDWEFLLNKLKTGGSPSVEKVRKLLSPEAEEQLQNWSRSKPLATKTKGILAQAINELLSRLDLYDEISFKKVKLPPDASALLEKGIKNLEEDQVRIFNRLLMETLFRGELKKSRSKTADMLYRIGIRTIEDILYHFPREYQDRRSLTGLDRIEPDKYQVVTGTLGEVFTRRVKGGLHLTRAVLYDDFGSLYLVWFNQPYIAKSLKRGKKYIASGKVEYKYKQMQIGTPELEEWEGTRASGEFLTPVYPLTGGLSQRLLRKIILSCVRKFKDLPIEVFPEDFRRRLGLLTLGEALEKIHIPRDAEDSERGKLRILFEEAFFMQFMIARYRRSYRNKIKERNYSFDSYLAKEFEDTLKFQLTEAQKRAIEEIREDMTSTRPMNRLLQGDVGSGKTVICIFFALAAARSGCQAAILAPTEVLAEQHYYNFREFLKQFNIDVKLLIGATERKEKEEIKSLLESGELKVVVGTHALLQEDVTFKNLSFAVVDEQHKFGVLQRAALKDKGRGADFLFTTATPIPRSMCFTLYGDLDITVLDEIPPGRKPVKTFWVGLEEKERVYAYMEKELQEGGQAYIVCPLIEESEKLDLTDLTNELERVQERFPRFNVGLLHGRMKSTEKEQVMGDFSSGRYHILVSTTVIEVGVDIPGASLMVILDAQRYGLGQLHQLRGRVGRGERKSACILVSSGNSTADSYQRLKIISNTHSGFEIAEEDLKLRGPGDIMGYRQSGLPELKFLDIVRDYKIIQRAREEAFNLEKEDPDLSGNEYMLLRKTLQQKYKKIWDIIH